MQFQESVTSLEDLQQYKHDLVSLCEHPGWKRLKEMLDQQCRLRRVSVFQLQPQGLDDAFKLTRLQGEVAGLQFVSTLVGVLIDDLVVEIAQRLEIEREETANGRPE
jgi:hypothetical protein